MLDRFDLDYKKTAVLVFLILLIFTRFWNLNNTTRFTRDESQNLVDMHRIWVDKDITLIGPIDDTKTIIYPSLTFYMLLPFAWLGDFAPVSPAYGTAFFGILAVLLVLYLVRKINEKYLALIAVLLLVWIPFVESARWAWNPHLVPFLQTIAIIFLLKNGRWNRLLSGIFFGLTFHLHYLSFVGFAAFLAIFGIYKVYKKKYQTPLFIGVGFALTILPFIYFDLKNPPGLFFGRFMDQNMVKTGFSYELQNFWQVFFGNLMNVLEFLAQDPILAIFLGIGVMSLLYKDIKKRRRSLFYFIPLIAQIAIISFLPTFATRYFLLAIIFFIVWLVWKRSEAEAKVVKGLIVLMIFGSLMNLRAELTEPKMIPTTYTVDISTDLVIRDIEKNDLNNINLAVLASEDRDPLGDVYRHTLLVKEQRILSEYEYHLTDNLFVISTSELNSIKEDPSNILNDFRDTDKIFKHELDNGWKVYRFSKNK